MRREGECQRDEVGPVGTAAASEGAGSDGKGLGCNGNILGHIKKAWNFLLVLHGYRITKLDDLALIIFLPKIEQKNRFY